jgi:hypothetical protein
MSKIYISSFAKQPILTRRSTVPSPPLQQGFPGKSNVIHVHSCMKKNEYFLKNGGKNKIELEKSGKVWLCVG